MRDQSGRKRSVGPAPRLPPGVPPSARPAIPHGADTSRASGGLRSTSYLQFSRQPFTSVTGLFKRFWNRCLTRCPWSYPSPDEAESKSSGRAFRDRVSDLVRCLGSGGRANRPIRLELRRDGQGQGTLSRRPGPDLTDSRPNRCGGGRALERSEARNHRDTEDTEKTNTEKTKED
jgi:hypothetical protein